MQRHIVKCFQLNGQTVRDKLKFCNNYNELFNKQWKGVVGRRANILKVTKEWVKIDANATVDFETHIKDPTNTNNFNPNQNENKVEIKQCK